MPFLFFFPIVCVVAWALKNLRARNSFLLATSYFFYMSWEPKYGLLLAFCSLVAYIGGLLLEKSRKKTHLIIFIGILLSSLFLFKYLDFASSTVTQALQSLGMAMPIPLPKLLLPVGISFFTFQAIGYLVDVYQNKICAERNVIDFTLFVSFFPQLVAGPIERAGNLLRQFKVVHAFDYDMAVQGSRQMLWGYFLKIVVADRLALYCDTIFSNLAEHSGTTLLLATFFFAIQIYCDFAGYSLIAIGCSRIMGFSLMKNFDAPYFSYSVSEFWKRWHISLSNWLRDYIYIPLGGNRCSAARHKVNIIATFLVSGIWHGANWTFVIWGLCHGLFQVVEKILGIDKASSRIATRILQRITTFLLVSLAWIFFRANSLDDAIVIFQKIFDFKNYSMPFLDSFSTMAFCVIAIAMLFCKDFLDCFLPKHKVLILKTPIRRYIAYLSILTWILVAGVFDNGQFIYFQF